MSGAGVARAWRGRGAGISCSPRAGHWLGGFAVRAPEKLAYPGIFQTREQPPIQGRISWLAPRAVHKVVFSSVLCSASACCRWALSQATFTVAGVVSVYGGIAHVFCSPSARSGACTHVRVHEGYVAALQLIGHACGHWRAAAIHPRTAPSRRGRHGGTNKLTE
eukprot:gene8989-biopygen15214